MWRGRNRTGFALMQGTVGTMATPIETALVAQVLSVIALAPERSVGRAAVGTAVALAIVFAFATALLHGAMVWPA